MVPLLRLSVPFLLFPLASAVVLRFASKVWRLPLFAVINVLGTLGICLVNSMSGLYFWQLKSYLSIAVPVFVIYFALVAFHFLLVRAFAQRPDRIAWLALLFPIAFMLVVKYAPGVSEPFRADLEFLGKRHVAEFFVGISYMAFRLSHMAMEVRNGAVPVPTFSEYLSFAFFVPTLAIGPINPYSTFRQSLHQPDRTETPAGRSVLRIIIGLTKYLFLASLVEQLSYKGLLLDGHPHPPIDLLVAGFAFFMYLYLNFSGYCDMAIGTAGLLGIRVAENFDRPFHSRNIQEFWMRWHMTLTGYFRDMVFSPLSHALIRKFGPQSTPHAIAAAIAGVFLLMGAWHGLSWNYLIYGALHGFGVVVCHYYTMFLKNRLGKQGYNRYNRNNLIRWAATGLTFAYAGGTLFFFANSLSNVRAIFEVLR